MNTHLTPTISVHSGVRRRLGCLLLALAIAPALCAAPGGKSGNNPGKGKGQSPDFVPPGQVGKDVPPGLRRAPVEVIVLKAPPSVRVETIPVRPSARHMWVPGFWTWEADAYLWTPGVWMLPPESAAAWIAPRVESRSGVTVYISGYWKL